MKILPQKFTKKGFKYQQLKREGNVAVYKKTSAEFSKALSYEVIIITSHNGITIAGNYIEPGELYPSTAQWGDKGWTYTTILDAESGFKKALKKVSRSEKNKQNKTILTKKLNKVKK